MFKIVVCFLGLFVVMLLGIDWLESLVNFVGVVMCCFYILLLLIRCRCNVLWWLIIVVSIV